MKGSAPFAIKLLELKTRTKTLGGSGRELRVQPYFVRSGQVKSFGIKCLLLCFSFSLESLLVAFSNTHYVTMSLVLECFFCRTSLLVAVACWSHHRELVKVAVV